MQSRKVSNIRIRLHTRLYHVFNYNPPLAFPAGPLPRFPFPSPFPPAAMLPYLHPSPPAPPRSHLWIPAFAASLVLLWGLLYAFAARDAVCDEPGHLFDMEHFATAKAGVPFGMTMLPGYHFVVNTLTGGHPSLFAARLTSAGFSLLMLLCFMRMRSLVHGQSGKWDSVLLVSMPLLQPFQGMAYTDAPGVAALFLAFWAYLRGLRFLATLSLLLACAIRQSNLAWGLFFLADAVLHPPTSAPGTPFLRFWIQRSLHALRNFWGIPVLFLIALAAFLHFGRLTLDTGHGNSWTPNIATLFTGGWIALLLGLPVLLLRAKEYLHIIKQSLLTRPVLSLLLGFVIVAASFGLYALFHNPHIWNRELFWPDCRFTLLRNWPLVWAEKHPLFRLLSAFNVVLMAIALAREVSRQPLRREILLIGALGTLLLCTSQLVEPRYFIPPIALALCYWRWEERAARWTTMWFATLSIVHAPFILRGLSLW